MRLALTEFSARSTTGVWVVAHFPDAALRLVTYAVLVLEWAVPLLLLSPWRRESLRAACGLALVGMHWAMRVLMDIGSFPSTMIAAATALLPASLWNWLARLRPNRVLRSTDASSVVGLRADSIRFRQHLIVGFLALCMLVNIEGNRLLGLDAGHRSPYPRANWVLKLKYLLGVESLWTMYAPEPARYGGWWVALGRLQDGREIDLVTGKAPTIEPPFPRRGEHAGLRGHYWSAPPYQGGPQHTYLQFLLWRNQRSDESDRVVDLHLVYIYECYEPACLSGGTPARSYPPSIMKWPQDQPIPEPEGYMLYRADFDQLGASDWQPARVEPEAPSP